MNQLKFNRLLVGDCRKQIPTLPAGCAHTCVTSPPYWGLRDYGHDDQIGLEKTPEEYVEKMVAIFREVHRVLRDDGTIWLNIGDSYANDGKWGGSSGGKHVAALHGASGVGRGRRATGLKPKDLVGIPWRVAFALQADGWYLRSDIIWAKPNPMPESVQDRPTKAHEYIFLMSKSARYYYDAEAIKEPATYGNHPRSVFDNTPPTPPGTPPHAGLRSAPGAESGRNKRTVWTVVSQPYAEAHFATFPPALIKPCILAGTSEAGCCAECGAPREREREREREIRRTSVRGEAMAEAQGARARTNCSGTVLRPATSRTIGWRPTCDCGAASEPCVVLDPFMGSGTTAQVAQDMGRRWIGCEINPGYVPLIQRRTAQATLPMMAKAGDNS